jgi:hypothetical protein
VNYLAAVGLLTTRTTIAGPYAGRDRKHVFLAQRGAGPLSIQAQERLARYSISNGQASTSPSVVTIAAAAVRTVQAMKMLPCCALEWMVSRGHLCLRRIDAATLGGVRSGLAGRSEK